MQERFALLASGRFWDAIFDSLTVVDVLLLRWLLIVMSSMVERQRVAAIEYLIAENRVLREQLGEGRLKFSDAQRRRLGIKGRVLGRSALGQLGVP